MKKKFLINGVRHYVPAEQLDAFYMNIVGHELIAVPEPSNEYDAMAIALFEKGKMIGHVSANTLSVVWACFWGSGATWLKVYVDDTDRVMNSLLAHINIKPGQVSDKAFVREGLLDDWDYDGPLLHKTDKMFELEANSSTLLDMLLKRRSWDAQMEGIFGCICELLHLDHSREMQERLAAIKRCLEKSRKPENRSKAAVLQKAINNSNNNEGRDRTWNHLRENSLSDTFRTEAVRWYEEGRVQDLLDGLPECYRKAYRDPRKLLGQAHYRGLSHEKMMQLLSFAAAMAYLELNGYLDKQTFKVINNYHAAVGNAISHVDKVLTPQNVENHD